MRNQWLKYIGRTKLSALIIFGTLASSCQRDPDSENGFSARRVSVEFTLGVRTPQAPSALLTRNQSEAGIALSCFGFAETRAVEDEEISNLWIVQFGEDGNSLISPEYLTSQHLTKNEKAGYTTYGFVASLVESDNSVVYLVANSANPGLFPSALTLDEFKQMRVTFAGYSEIESKGDIMVGSYSGNIAGTPQPFAWLERIVSKIGLTVGYTDPLPTPGGTLNLTSSQVRSIPTTASFYPQQSPFPDSGPTASALYIDSEITYGDPRGITPVYYVTENKRGENNAVTDEKLKWRENDPSWENETSYATHVVLRGTYDPGNIPNIGLATITLYPGENNKSDYNLVRNSSYVMNVDISELNVEDGPDKDYRIEIDYDPFITYRYYYEKEQYDNEAEKYEYLGEEYLTGDNVSAGSSVVATSDILNLMKHLTPTGGDYKDGAADPDPLVVSADNRQNIVEVRYDLNVQKNYTVQINYLRNTSRQVLREPRFVTYPEGTIIRISTLKTVPGLVPDGFVGNDGNEYQRYVPTGETSITMTVDQDGLKWDLFYDPLNITSSQRYIKYIYVYGDKDGPELQPADLVLATGTYYYPYNAPNYMIPGYAFIGSDPESIRRLDIPAGTMQEMYIIYTDGEIVTFNYVEHGTGMVIKDPVTVWLPIDETFTEDVMRSTAFLNSYKTTVYHDIVIFNNNAYELMPELTVGVPFTVSMGADHNVIFSYQCISYVDCILYDIAVRDMFVISSGFYYLGPGAVFDRIEIVYTWPNGQQYTDPETYLKGPGESIDSFVMAGVMFQAYDFVMVTYKLYLKDTPNPVTATSSVIVRAPN